MNIDNWIQKWICLTWYLTTPSSQHIKNICMHYWMNWDIFEDFQFKFWFFPPQTLKEMVHSEMKNSEKIKLGPNIMPFASIFFKSVSFPSDINSDAKISLPGPALSLPWTCIITCRPALFYCILSVKKNKTNGRKLT